MRVITISGIDKSGKTSLGEKLWNVLGRRAMVIDRDISGHHFFNEIEDRVSGDLVYAREYKRKLGVYRQLVDLAVILEVEEEDWKERCKKTNEPPLIGELNFVDHQKKLISIFNKAKYKNVLRLNTSDLSIDECLSIILKRLGVHNANK